MKLINYVLDGKSNIGVLMDNMIYKTKYDSLIDIMTDYSLDNINDISISSPISKDNIVEKAIIPNPIQDVLCAGLNYYDHKEECLKADLDKSKEVVSVYFSKRCFEAKTNNDKISLHEDITNEVDYEGELGVILGCDLLSPKTKEEAMKAVFGYVIINDVSARDIQHHHQQYHFGKSLDGFTSVSSVLVTADEFDIQPHLDLKTFVNDELRQNSNTGNMIFSIADMLYELSQGITLKRGTILSTGTPSGVGKGFNPPKLLKKGDVVRIEIEKIGSLTNIFE